MEEMAGGRTDTCNKVRAKTAEVQVRQCKYEKSQWSKQRTYFYPYSLLEKYEEENSS